MRTQVERVQVDVHDIYEEARASMLRPERRHWPLALVTMLAALSLGAAVGWAIALHGPIPTGPLSLAPLAGDPAKAPVAVALKAQEPARLLMAATRDAGPAQVAAAARLIADETAATGAVWPIILHRAGDNRFYADLSLDGHLINILVDPALRVSRLTPTALPADNPAATTEWQAEEVVLEHLRLPPTRFVVSLDPEAEAAIGADLLARHFVVEEQFDRLRLVPRQSGS